MRRCPRENENTVFMAYIQGEGRNQGTLFPVVLDDFVPADHLCRVIDAFVEKLVMPELGSAMRSLRIAGPSNTGRPGRMASQDRPRTRERPHACRGTLLSRVSPRAARSRSSLRRDFRMARSLSEHRNALEPAVPGICPRQRWSCTSEMLRDHMVSLAVSQCLPSSSTVRFKAGES
jgi:hypothetical protein